MNSTEQQQLELTAILNLVPYLDKDFNYKKEMTLSDMVAELDGKAEFENDTTFQTFKSAVLNSPYGDVVLVDQSSTNKSAEWTDDLIQACTFRDAQGNYYVAYRGTGDGRWADNGDGMTKEDTIMQKAAQKYFDEMAEKYFADAHEQGKEIIISGHSKGGNEAQFVFMTSEYEYLIDKCYSYNGQGFSRKARENFIKKYGDEYDEKLSRMYSVCGRNDYVHDLGYVIIPEENTYFVETEGDTFESYHALENMIGKTDKDGNRYYSNLSWDIKDGEITHGEQGDLGKFAKKISEAMMELDDEDLNGAAIAVMSMVDPYSNDEILGDVKIKITDYIDLVAHGLPVALETLLTTPEGWAFTEELIKYGAEKLYEKYGKGGLVAGLATGGLLLIFAVPFVVAIINLAKVADLIVTVFENIVQIAGKIKECISKMKDAIVSAIKKVAAKIKSLSAGYKYASANPQIKLDTYKLQSYAERLRSVNRRISNLDRRLDSLYWQVGLLDLWNLMSADIMTGYSWRLLRCAGYLGDTAKDFASIESELTNSL